MIFRKIKIDDEVNCSSPICALTSLEFFPKLSLDCGYLCNKIIFFASITEKMESKQKFVSPVNRYNLSNALWIYYTVLHP